jgi:arsenite-transporting ATPase
MNNNGLCFLNENKPSLIMFTGKGGVGKTTASSSTAVYFAQSGLRTLLISTDPAPSLSDMFDRNVNGVITPIESVPSLSVVELDYDLIVELWKKKYGEEVYSVASSFLPVDREIIDYVAGAPGMDQEFALGYLLDLHRSGDYDIIIWDTAPAGGTLSLLNLQETLYTHLGEAAKMYMRVKKALETLSQGRAKEDPLKMIAKWEQLSKDVLNMMRADSTMGFVVTNPEALCVNQANRVVEDLNKFGIHVGGIVLNRVLTEEAADSEFNKQRRDFQLKYIDELETSYKEKLPIVQIPLMPFEVKGVDALTKVSAVLFPE